MDEPEELCASCSGSDLTSSFFTALKLNFGWVVPVGKSAGSARAVVVPCGKPLLLGKKSSCCWARRASVVGQEEPLLLGKNSLCCWARRASVVGQEEPLLLGISNSAELQRSHKRRSGAQVMKKSCSKFCKIVCGGTHSRIGKRLLRDL